MRPRLPIPPSTRRTRRTRRRGFRGARFALPLLLVSLASCAQTPTATQSAPRAGDVSDARLRAADADTSNWLSHGRTYAEQRYSPLSQIDSENISQLGLAWSADLHTPRGVQATPLVVDGVMYVTAPWSVVHALDAATGEERWRYDPQVSKTHSRFACCSVASRGVAVHEGRVFVGTLDGRLVAVDASDGSPVWETLTVDPAQPYTITGAPRVVKGLVVIGNGGAEYGVRGYVSAYRSEDGSLAWRTYTVPGDPSLPFESLAMEKAAATWTGEWWRYGGGGTVWDALAYDPDLDLLYVGSGNGSPHARWARSPQGGDNLYLASILALRPESGEQVWHFQTTPADSWDYTATQHIMLADLEIDGRVRKVVMQAPKNGFFFVLDRETGEFLSGAAFVKMNWALGLDAEGRPIESEYADYRSETRMIHPSPIGGHNWHPMSFHPGTGLVYIPTLEIGMPMTFDEEWVHRPGRWNLAVRFDGGYASGGDEARGYLQAWDPVAQRPVWRVDHLVAWNGGTLATGDNLLFQGSADGRMVAYRADTGEMLWESPAGTGVMAGPVTYAVDGQQYIAVAAGWGGSFPMGMGGMAAKARVRGGGRVLAFRLGGDAELPPGLPWPGPPPMPSFSLAASEADLEEGSRLYHLECGVCHGGEVVGGGSVPDLRYSTEAVHERFQAIVHGGERAKLGMPSFGEILSEQEVRKVHAYVLSAARQAAGGDTTP